MAGKWKAKSIILKLDQLQVMTEVVISTGIDP